jgi:hypothetical protein
MKASVPGLLVGITLVAVLGCSHGPKEAAPPPPAKLGGATETVTGKVVLVAEGYRLKLTDESEDLLRLTRAKKSSELAAEEINLRKYYEKTLVVRGRRQDEWIWAAEITGQWLRPGERRGSNLTAPPVEH